MEQPINAMHTPPRDYRPIIIIALAVALAVNGALVGFAFWLSAQRARVELSDPQLLGVSDLCPGETLDYRFRLYVTKAASVDLYTSVQRLLPNDRVSYTRLQQFRFDHETELEIDRHWVLPLTYQDPVTGSEIAWLPGQYVQRTTATVVGSREDEPPQIEMPFSVRVSCGGE